ncbi:cupin domain-containing protein [Kitasatospora sp. NPDC056184]|uniref:cupin domain-containing protein n=1 Tax=Kitasatospora sp. NPDC056184 TaxID=3345738 RepID=UPI0035D57EB7
MRSAVVIADTTAPADVHGVHGAAGITQWTCLARRTGLAGDWEAVEWARIPAGGISGEHLHTRTREVYVLLTGEGEVTLDGRPHGVRAGDAVLTAAGTRHGLRNTGTGPLEWLVIELPAHPEEFDSGGRVGSTVVRDLRRTGPLDPSAVIGGPLRLLRHVELVTGERDFLLADGVEHTAFVLGGHGRAGAGDVRVPLRPGTALTLPLGTAVDLAAGPGGLAFLHAELVTGGRELPGGESPGGESRGGESRGGDSGGGGRR